MFEVGVEEAAAKKDFNKYEEVFLHEDIIVLLGICDFSRGIDPGGYRWTPTYSKWLKTFFWKLTIFSSFLVPKLLGPF
jgi:hypothetical protein